MYIIYIRNFKKRLFFFGSVLALWVVMFFVSDFILHNALICSVTVDNYFTFSYPFSFSVDDIYVNKYMESNPIETGFISRKPLEQKFSNYNSLQGRFSFNYPSAFILKQGDFTGSDILYHIDFFNESRSAHGFIQVWSLPYPLEKFLEMSKSNSQQLFKYFYTKPVTVNDMKGYLWDYAILGKDNKYYKGSEVFIQKGDKMYRISYFIEESKWNDKESEYFWNMVNSFKIY